MRWVEVPAHRVLEVDFFEFKRDFEELDESGNVTVAGYAAVYRIVRKSDRKVFRVPRYHQWMAEVSQVVYLEEI